MSEARPDMTAVIRDWQIGKKLPDRLHHMLTNELMCDITFLLGSERTRVKAHKLMLASASPVFSSMFDGPLPEKGDIQIPDIEADVFRDMLKFIYTDDVDLNTQNIKGLVYGSDKYMIQVLKEKCNSFMEISNINVNNACVVLQTTHDFHLESMRDDALQFIIENGESSLESEAFLMLSEKCVELIIESDNLICCEKLVYEKMLQWASNRCQEQKLDVTDDNLRQVLGHLLYLIRFPILDRSYFTLNVSKKSILTFEEKVKVYQTYDGEGSDLFTSTQRQQRRQNYGYGDSEDDDILK